MAHSGRSTSVCRTSASPCLRAFARTAPPAPVPSDAGSAGARSAVFQTGSRAPYSLCQSICQQPWRGEAVAPSCSRWGSWRAEPEPLPQEEVVLALDRGLRPSSALRPAGCSPWPALRQAHGAQDPLQTPVPAMVSPWWVPAMEKGHYLPIWNGSPRESWTRPAVVWKNVLRMSVTPAVSLKVHVALKTTSGRGVT